DNAGCQKRPVEILRCVNPEQVRESDGKRGISGEIEEQVERVGVHVREDVCEPGSFRYTIQPEFLYERRKNELIEESSEKSMNCAVQVLQEFSASPAARQVRNEAIVPVNRTGRNCREEQEECQIGPGSVSGDKPILNANDDVETAERHV